LDGSGNGMVCQLNMNLAHDGSVIGHGIGGKHIPAKMAQLAESQLLE
jgi:hypothetical protein